jgi:hypothetical protein
MYGTRVFGFNREDKSYIMIESDIFVIRNAIIHNSMLIQTKRVTASNLLNPSKVYSPLTQ